MKSILLTSLPKYDVVGPPAAIGVLQGICKEEGLRTEVFDFNIFLYHTLSKKEWDELDAWNSFIKHNISRELEIKICELWDKEIVKRMPPGCEYLLISVFSYWSMYIARLIIEHENKKLRPYKLIVGGNGVVSQFPDTKLYFKEWAEKGNLIEHLIIGEGETPLAQIITKGKIQYNDQNIDSYPFPSFSGFDLNDYTEKKVYITGSKGCVRKCTFCDIQNIWPKFRYRSAQSLVDEIKKHYYELGVTRFDFTDSLINGSVSNFYKFNYTLAEEKEKNPDLKNIGYLGQFICRPKHQMPPEHYEAMHYAGAKQLTIGIESFSNRVRDHMKKKFSDADIEYHLNQCQKWYIPNVFLMIACYPTETLEDHKKNLADLEKYKDFAKTGIIEFMRWGTTMHLVPDTPITSSESVKELKLTDGQNKEIFYDPYSQYGWLALSNPDLTIQERIRRRLEVHYKTVELGYPQPDVENDLNILRQMSQMVKERKENVT